MVSVTLEKGSSMPHNKYILLSSPLDIWKKIVIAFKECTKEYLYTRILHLIILLVLSCECEQAGIVKKEHIKIHGF